MVGLLRGCRFACVARVIGSLHLLYVLCCLADPTFTVSTESELTCFGIREFNVLITIDKLLIMCIACPSLRRADADLPADVKSSCMLEAQRFCS